VSFASDDLAQLFAAPQREHTGYGQGIIVTWNPETFENTISYRGSTLTNLPVMDRIGALTYKPGDVVLLMRWTPSGGGMSSYWIAGSPVIPGAGRAEQAIASLRTDLARQVALSVFGEAIHVDTNDGLVSIGDQNSGNNWIDLPGSPGPTVSNVEISESGRAWVFMTAQMEVQTHTTDAQIVLAAMSYEISGATSRAPSLLRALELQHTGQTIGDNDTNAVLATMTRAHVATGLNPGVHTFRAKYTALVAGSGQRVSFSQRELQVIPF